MTILSNFTSKRYSKQSCLSLLNIMTVSVNVLFQTVCHSQRIKLQATLTKRDLGTSYGFFSVPDLFHMGFARVWIQVSSSSWVSVCENCYQNRHFSSQGLQGRKVNDKLTIITSCSLDNFRNIRQFLRFFLTLKVLSRGTLSYFGRGQKYLQTKVNLKIRVY